MTPDELKGFARPGSNITAALAEAMSAADAWSE